MRGPSTCCRGPGRTSSHGARRRVEPLHARPDTDHRHVVVVQHLRAADRARAQRGGLSGNALHSVGVSAEAHAAPAGGTVPRWRATCRAMFAGEEGCAVHAPLGDWPLLLGASDEA
eukprot:6112456-Prymnesium_polylepis.1